MSKKSEELRSDQLAPHSIEAEEAALGTVLIDPGNMNNILWLQNDDFFIVRHAWIWESMKALHERRMPLDYLTITSDLEQRGRLAEIGGAAYVLSLINKTPSGLNAEGYADIVKRMAIRRRLVDHAQVVARLAHSDELDLQNILQRCKAGLDEVWDGCSSLYARPSNVGDVAADILMETARWHGGNVKHGLQTGISAIDKFIRGLRKRKLYYMAGWPTHGKSAALTRIAWALAEQGARVMYNTLEMSAFDTVCRMACQKSHIIWNDVEDGKLSASDQARWEDALKHFINLADGHSIIFDEEAGLSVADYRAKTRLAERQYGPVDLVIVDSLNYVSEKGDSTTDRTTAASRNLKIWATDPDSDFAIAAVTHLTKPPQGEKDPIPTMYMLRDSGMLAADPDMIIGVNQPWLHYKPADKELKPHMEHIMHWWMLKNRQYGQTGNLCRLAFGGGNFAIEELHTRTAAPEYTQAGFTQDPEDLI